METDLLFTTDFGPLVGKNCKDAGKIAALNAISDIYARGGIALYACVIMIIGNDINKREREVLLSSIIETCKEEKIEVVGGHTISGKQTIVGLTLIGKKDDIYLKKEIVKLGMFF